MSNVEVGWEVARERQFTNIGHTFGKANFGRATAAEAEREMQLGLKFYF